MLPAPGCAWNACLTFEPDRLNRMLTPEDRQHISNVLQNEFSDSASFVFKDPRPCLTIQAWLPASRSAEASIRALLACLDQIRVSFADWRGATFPSGFRPVFPASLTKTDNHMELRPESLHDLPKIVSFLK